jgi:long-chain acyl-CoA synthetase
MDHLAALLDAACARWPRRLAIEGVEASLTYGDLDRVAAGIAAGLKGAGLRPDEPVGLRVANRARDLAGFLGTWRAGGVVVPIHRSTIAGAVDDILRRTGLRFMVDGDAPEPVARLDRPAPAARPVLAGAAFVIFTSGTTGNPKGVVLAHDRFAAKLRAIDEMVPFAEETRTLLVLQLTFSFGQWVSLLTLARGGTLLMEEKFDAARVLDRLAASRANRIGIVPTMLRAMLPRLRGAEGVRHSGALDDGVARLFMAGGEPLPHALGRAFRSLVPGLALDDIYGLTETSTCDFHLPDAEQDRFPGTIGRPSRGVEFAIHDDDGRPLPPRVAGELVLRTPFIMKGSLDAPDLTSAAFRGAWFRTGDLAEALPQGIVRLVGRSKELILRAGNKVSPLEVERAYLDHPEIAEALATGLPDPLLGEAIHLLVVPVAGADPKPEALREWAVGRLDKWKVPDRIHLGAAIPLGRTGKADRAALREALDRSRG